MCTFIKWKFHRSKNVPILINFEKKILLRKQENLPDQKPEWSESLDLKKQFGDSIDEKFNLGNNFVKEKLLKNSIATS